MYKLCKWIYDLAYNHGYEEGRKSVLEEQVHENMNEEILRRRDLFKAFLEKEIYAFEMEQMDISVPIENIMTLYKADIEMLSQKFKRELCMWAMNYDSKDGYSTMYDEVLEHLVSRIDNIKT